MSSQSWDFSFLSIDKGEQLKDWMVGWFAYFKDRKWCPPWSNQQKYAALMGGRKPERQFTGDQEERQEIWFGGELGTECQEENQRYLLVQNLCMGENKGALTKNSSWLLYFKLWYLWLLSCYFYLCWCLEPNFILFFAFFRLIATLRPPRLLLIWLVNNWYLHDTVTVDPILIQFYSWKVTEGHLIQPLTFQMRKWSMERLCDCIIEV